MSLFDWLFRKTGTGHTGAEPAGAPSADTNAPLGAGRAAPTTNPAANRKNERMERRELLYLVVRDIMVRSSVLSASYKFKVLSLDEQGRQFLVMIDLAHEYGGDTTRLSEIEALIAQTAKTRFDVLVTGVYWRINEHIAVGQPQSAGAGAAAPAPTLTPRPQRRPAVAPVAAAKPAPTVEAAPPLPVLGAAPAPQASAAVTIPPPPPASPPPPVKPLAATVTVSTPAPESPLLAPRSDLGGAGRYDPIEADEVAAFKRALNEARTGGAPTNAAASRMPASGRTVSVSAPTGFEDTELPEDSGKSHNLGQTQYGALH